MAFGVTNEGFIRKRLSDIRLEIEETLRTSLGNQINLLPESVFGQLVGIISERESLIWELSEGVYNSAFPDTAFGTSLDNVTALTGITRQGAQESQAFDVRLFGTALTVVPAGTQIQVQGNPNAVFQTTENATIQGGQNAQDTITFDAVPDAGSFRLNFRGQDTQNFMFNALASDLETELNTLDFGSGITVSGDFVTGFVIDYDGDAGLQEQATISIDENVLSSAATPVEITANQTQVGINQATVNAIALEVGPTQAPAGTLSVIVNPVGGLDRVLNVTDANLGRVVETDNELRARREETLQVAGSGTPEAIVSRLRDLVGVEDAFVFENQTEIFDMDGRPPHSFEVVVNGGETQEIIQLLWEIKPAGIRTVGSINGTAIDSSGQPQSINFSRPTNVDIFLEVDLTIDPQNFPANGLAAAESALVTQGNAFGIGGDVVVIPTLICALNSIPGIVDIDVRIGTAASPTLDQNIPIAVNEVPVFDTSRTTVVAI